MPTYDYRCQACDHTFEHFQSIHAARLKKCPKCGKSKLERLIGMGGGLLFKGSGFYITDYRSSDYHDAAKKDAPAAADGATPATTKDGAKPAAAAKDASPESGAGKAAAPAKPPASRSSPSPKSRGSKPKPH